MKIQNKKHIPWLDVAKGLGITLVVIGHCLFPKHLLIDSFHMPLFFILAGMTFSTKAVFGDFIKKKIVRIVLPFAFWVSLSFLCSLENDPLWFLYTLFFALILFYPLCKYIKGMWLGVVMLTLSLMLWGNVSFIGELNESVIRILSAMIYVYVGFVSNQLIIRCYSYLLSHLNKERDKPLCSTKIILLLPIALSMLFVFIVLVAEKLDLIGNVSFIYLSLFKINWFLVVTVTLLGASTTIAWANASNIQEPFNGLERTH